MATAKALQASELGTAEYGATEFADLTGKCLNILHILMLN